MLDNFLGCFKLRTGCLLIGYCGAIFSMLFLILGGIVISFTTTRDCRSGLDKAFNELYMVLAIYIFIICAVSFPLHVVLLRGVYKKLPRLLNIYLYGMIGYLLITFIIALVASMYGPRQVFSYVLSFALNVYYLAVVKSHRMEIENSIKLPPQYTKT